MLRSFLLLPILLSAAQPVRVFEAAKVDTVYRVLLDRGALLLESINSVIKQKGVTDGQVLVTAGSVSECTYHYVSTTAEKPTDVVKTVKGPFEILSAGGIIADGEPHLHISLSGPQQGAFGGHLENGCKILYLGEVTIIKYSGQALTRKKNANGISLLQAK
jgi:predicted DNA-binding protein with PD1-like motif